MCLGNNHFVHVARPLRAGRQLRLRRPGLIAEATKSMDVFDLVSKERVDTAWPSLPQLPAVERLPSAKHEV